MRTEAILYRDCEISIVNPPITGQWLANVAPRHRDFLHHFPGGAWVVEGASRDECIALAKAKIDLVLG